MDEKRKAELYDKCCIIVEQLDWSDTAVVLQLIMADSLLSSSLIGQMSSYLSEQFNMKISMID